MTSLNKIDCARIRYREALDEVEKAFVAVQTLTVRSTCACVVAQVLETTSISNVLALVIGQNCSTPRSDEAGAVGVRAVSGLALDAV